MVMRDISYASLLKPIQAFRWFVDQGGQWNSGWNTCVTRIIPKTEVPFSPLVTAPFVKVPVLMMNGKNDEMPQVIRKVQLEVFNRQKSRKHLYEIDGDHFGALSPKHRYFMKQYLIKVIL